MAPSAAILFLSYQQWKPKPSPQPLPGAPPPPPPPPAAAATSFLVKFSICPVSRPSSPPAAARSKAKASDATTKRHPTTEDKFQEALELGCWSLGKRIDEGTARFHFLLSVDLCLSLIAVEGCLHGELDDVYASIRHVEKVEVTKIDLLIRCGDFLAVRNENDLESLTPVPTIYIGGNHETSNYLWELYYGGWAAPNIYFLGVSVVIKFGNIQIGGISGIYKQGHFHLDQEEDSRPLACCRAAKAP
ncbi:hypothetical protein OPV22_013461 [Ensete ventricosum]|uniref:Calcineurin-like phosphoesterase domain-containing protein n=1 Tax=Ensete ventricosum TaxID=4639 RepID=A0AAV8R8C9_ENSVE|nr:hypothetical protein OPV22_013461 [Ensete ventricosum]